jgi:filamentous hemagglutinin
MNQLTTGRTYNQLVTSNVKSDPVGATVAGAGMVGLGYMTGGTGTALGVKMFGAGVGALANYAFQTGATDWTDVGTAGITGFIATGAGLTPSLLTNVGGALASSGIKGENPNASVGGATVGTVLGYGIGRGVVEIPLNNRINPWWRPVWLDVGLGINTPVTPSPLPGMTGGVFSSGAQEPIGNNVKDALQRVQGK